MAATAAAVAAIFVCILPMGGESDPIGGVLELGVVVDKFGDKSVPIIELFTD